MSKRTLPSVCVVMLLVLAASLCGCAGAGAAGLAKPHTLTVLTYNVLASEHQDAQRFPALFRIIEQSQADILCLQEVLPGFLDRLRKQPWFGERYVAPKVDGLDAIANGNYICSRYEVDRVEVVDHQSPQGRESIIVHLIVDGQPLAVATCHLESLLRDGPVRAKQLDDVFGRLEKVGDALFAGDFNFGDGEQPDSAHLAKDYADAWLQLHPEDPGFTWDIEASDMAARGSFVDEPSRRIDRILVRSKKWLPHSIEIVGAESIDSSGRLFPSDHFGLLGTLRAAN